VKICDGPTLIAEHPRSYGKGMRIEDPEHVRALLERKRAARREGALDHLVQAVPESRRFLKLLAEKGLPLNSTAGSLLSLLGEFPASEISFALAEAIERETLHLAGIRQILDRRLHERLTPPLSPMWVPEKVRNLSVRTHDLADYDRLWEERHEPD